MIFSSSIHVAANGIILFVFMAEEYSIVYMCNCKFDFFPLGKKKVTVLKIQSDSVGPDPGNQINVASHDLSHTLI